VASIARTKGLILRPIGNVLVLMPPLSTSAEELKKMLEILKESVETLHIG
jgi:adenosylmethionine-8-amino-7-oxononanoate aminotransferase